MTIKLSDFVIERQTGVYINHRRKSRAFSYSDGAEVENKILNIIKEARDRSSNSMELELRINDWPTKYHLSNLRTNIIRSLDLLRRDSKILEIGAGCGAITRFIGETFNSVDSIEGNFKRAYITKERCRGLNNVKVYCSPLQDLSFEKNYDVVTLIGVLEYAPVFYLKAYKDKRDACLAMLKQAVSALNDHGILILAIENKFGLKYWSGCREDHTGKLFDSIHNYPEDLSPITFGKKELEKMLVEAGLKYYKFYYPFPDYKLTNTILREVPDPASYYLHNWLTVPFEDYSVRVRDYYFNETLAIKSLVKAGLIYELSNSFVIVTSMNPTHFKEESAQRWIAKRFSTNRILPYKTITILKQETDSDMLTVHKRKLFDEKQPNGFISLNVSDSKWFPGDLLEYSLCEAVYKSNGFNSFVKIFEKYHDALIRNYSTGKRDNEWYPMVTPNAVDFNPFNIILNGDEIFSIDLEWICSRPISADYVIFRAVFLFVLKQYPFILRNISIPEGNIDTFTISIIKLFYPQYNTKRHEINKKMEEEFQSIVSGKIVKLPSAEEVRIAKDKDQYIYALLNSYSWRITAPLRWLYKHFRKEGK